MSPYGGVHTIIELKDAIKNNEVNRHLIVCQKPGAGMTTRTLANSEKVPGLQTSIIQLDGLNIN